MSFQFTGDIKFLYTATSQDTLGPADVKVAYNDLVQDPGFETAVLISLFTDARADDTDELPENLRSRGGFFGSALAGFQIGSKLWLLNRARLSTVTAARAKQYCEDALAWMIADGIAETVVVETIIFNSRQLNIDIVITRPKGFSVSFGFYVNWENQLIGAAA